MDIVACLNRLLCAMVEGDRSEERAALSDLRAWIDKGGYVPVIEAAPTRIFPAQSSSNPTEPQA